MWSSEQCLTHIRESVNKLVNEVCTCYLSHSGIEIRIRNLKIHVTKELLLLFYYDHLVCFIDKEVYIE